MKRLVILLTTLLLLCALAGCSAPREYPTSFTGKDGTVVKVLPLEAAENENENQAIYDAPDWASLLGAGTDLVVKAKVTSIKLLELPFEATDELTNKLPRIEVEILEKLYGTYDNKTFRSLLLYPIYRQRRKTPSITCFYVYMTRMTTNGSQKPSSMTTLTRAYLISML